MNRSNYFNVPDTVCPHFHGLRYLTLSVGKGRGGRDSVSRSVAVFFSSVNHTGVARGRHQNTTSVWWEPSWRRGGIQSCLLRADV